MRHTPKSIVSYIFGFLVWFGGVIGLAYALVGLTQDGGGVSPSWTTFMVGGAMLLAIILVPLFFLKQFSRLSRHVEHDDSQFSVKHLTDHQDRPKIQYH